MLLASILQNIEVGVQPSRFVLPLNLLQDVLASSTEVQSLLIRGIQYRSITVRLFEVLEANTS